MPSDMKIPNSDYLGSPQAEIDNLRFKVRRLQEALRSLHDDCIEYSTINHLGGHNNHVLQRAREALGLPECWECAQRQIEAERAANIAASGGECAAQAA